MRKQRAERLRFAVESLPPETRRAMLDGIKENRIVTGANTDRRGGMCPMLAADRRAFEVTPLAGIFATAWDQYTGTSFVNVTRRVASERDLKTLQTMLEASLALTAPAPTSLDRMISQVHVEPAPRSRPDLAEASRQLTVAAKIELSRALGVTAPPPARPAPRPAPVPAPQLPRVAPTPAPVPVTCVAAARAAAATRRPASAPVLASAQTAPARTAVGRPPATRTQDELERERARAIIANQASALRARSWPREAPATPAPATAAAAPAVAPTPVPALGAPARERVPELAARSGWAWLRPFSSYDDYEQTLTELGETQRGPGADDGGTRREDTRRPEHAPA